MRNRNALALCGMLLIVCLPFRGNPSANAQIQVQGFAKGEWVQDNKLGFPVWTAANYVIDAPALSHRHVYMLVESQNFTEQNILKLFTSLAGEFKVPDNLAMYAYSDRAALQKALDEATSGILCILWAETPEGRRAARNHDIKTNPHRSGYYRAEYYRWPNGREVRVTFSPDPNLEHLKTIYHLNPSFDYSDPQKDFARAAERGHVEALRLRLTQANSAELLKTAGDKALRDAAYNGQAEVVNVLLNAGISAKSNGGNAALLAAATDGGAEIVQALLDRGADVNARTGRDKNGLDDTALMLAALHGHAEVVRVLLAKGAKLEDRNRFDETALMQAALAGFPEIIRLLAVKGADVNAHDVNGQTALMLAQDDRETVETLLGLGADYKVSDKDGVTSLMLAVRFREDAKQDALIAKGAGKESIEAAKHYVAAPPPPKEGMMPLEYVKEDGYRVLTGLYLKLGMKKEAVETGKQILEVLGDKAHLRGQLGFVYLAIGDKDAAMAQYKILKERTDKAQDKETKRLYQGWADALWRELNK